MKLIHLLLCAQYGSYAGRDVQNVFLMNKMRFAGASKNIMSFYSAFYLQQI